MPYTLLVSNFPIGTLLFTVFMGIIAPGANAV